MNLPSNDQSRRYIESALVLLFLLILLYALYNVLSIFFGVFTYAIILSVSFFPLFERFVRLLNNKRKIAAFLYALVLLAIMALPFIYIISSLSNYVQRVGQWIADSKSQGVPDLPAWITSIPKVGEKASAFWQKLQNDPAGTLSLYEPQINAFLRRLISGGIGMIGASLEFILGIIISAVFLASGRKILQPLYRGATKFFGDQQGPELVNAAGRAVKGVAVGVMGTAFIAALLAWIGFSIAGISFAAGLAALTFFLVVIQVGPLLVWLPVAIWLGMHGETGWAIFVSIYGIIVLMGVDNILKPVLIAKSGKLPILVLFLGVVGGMAAWGFTGMFKGAIILALFYTVVRSWIGTDDISAESAIKNNVQA